MGQLCTSIGFEALRVDTNLHLTCRPTFHCYWALLGFWSIWKVFGMSGRPRFWPLGVDSGPAQRRTLWNFRSWTAVDVRAIDPSAARIRAAILQSETSEHALVLGRFGGASISSIALKPVFDQSHSWPLASI